MSVLSGLLGKNNEKRKQRRTERNERNKVRRLQRQARKKERLNNRRAGKVSPESTDTPEE